jgi:hypothetical protein
LDPPVHEILFDDDDSGEAADVVGIARADGALKIDFFHSTRPDI